MSVVPAIVITDEYGHNYLEQSKDLMTARHTTMIRPDIIEELANIDGPVQNGQ